MTDEFIVGLIIALFIMVDYSARCWTTDYNDDDGY